MEKIVEQGLLYDFYGVLLTKHQKEIYEKVVYENQSLGEIAEAEGISKQAVHDLVRRATSLMHGYEEKLGMIERFRKLEEQADRLITLTEEENFPTEYVGEVLAVAEEIQKDLK